MRAMKSIRIIGLGNVLRGDDAAGILVARHLRGLRQKGIETVEIESGGPELLEYIEGADLAILIDAVQSGSKAGTIHFLDVTEGPIGLIVVPHSTHGINILETLELGRVLQRFPKRVLLYGIEAGCVEIGERLSPQVNKAVKRVATRIRTALKLSAYA